eukprot:TRINITY_DN2373_c0_g1_i4.p1 TRINITY_DN2373_c0_g1~~TRINITY_DN2373_c0_g1_i4.p1  ORF type:complete len:597 (+),score=110.86 TRINITY_DN2373_c0_g1_i4:56-1792(+)
MLGRSVLALLTLQCCATPAAAGAVLASTGDWLPCPSAESLTHVTHLVTTWGLANLQESGFRDVCRNASRYASGELTPPARPENGTCSMRSSDTILPCATATPDYIRSIQEASKKLLLAVGPHNLGSLAGQALYGWPPCDRLPDPASVADALVDDIVRAVTAGQSDGWEYDGVVIDMMPNCYQQDWDRMWLMDRLTPKLHALGKIVAVSDTAVAAGRSQETGFLHYSVSDVDMVILTQLEKADIIQRAVDLVSTYIKTVSAGCDEACALGRIVFSFCDYGSCLLGMKSAEPALQFRAAQLHDAYPLAGGLLFWTAGTPARLADSFGRLMNVTAALVDSEPSMAAADYRADGCRPDTIAACVFLERCGVGAFWQACPQSCNHTVAPAPGLVAARSAPPSRPGPTTTPPTAHPSVHPVPPAPLPTAPPSPPPLPTASPSLHPAPLPTASPSLHPAPLPTASPSPPPLPTAPPSLQPVPPPTAHPSPSSAAPPSVQPSASPAAAPPSVHPVPPPSPSPPPTPKPTERGAPQPATPTFLTEHPLLLLAAGTLCFLALAATAQRCRTRRSSSYTSCNEREMDQG